MNEQYDPGENYLSKAVNMGEDKTIEGNKIIAVFMGAEWKKDDYDSYGYYSDTFPNWNYWQTPAALKYHSSWNWIMPVVEKIEHEFTPIEILDTQCRIGRLFYNKEEILISSDESKIEAVWLAVFEFIKWYNQNKK